MGFITCVSLGIKKHMKKMYKPTYVMSVIRLKRLQELKLSIAAVTLMLLLCFVFSLTGTAQKHSASLFNNLDANGIILDGYDAVAFFTDNKPVKGIAEFQFKYEGAVYQFASKEHLDLFKANPDKYKPQFGGWCAYAVSLGRIAPIDVNNFSIVDGRLFIQHNQRAVNGWNKDVPGNIVKADKYWPDVASHHGKQITTDEEKGFYNNANDDGVTMEGYDAVAYFTDKKAVKGSSQFSARYNGATSHLRNMLICLKSILKCLHRSMVLSVVMPWLLQEEDL
jgi:YHS domain-containing protein